MKKFCISFLLLAIIVLSITGMFIEEPAPTNEYLRIHVRANSNDKEEQAVKYKVKDAVVEFLSPIIAECTTKQKAQALLMQNESEIKRVADKVLKQNGFNYQARVEVKQEIFPTRVYNGVELKSGVYDALIIELGSGKGDNWWCVVYPPLCFTGEGTSYVYRSKILQIIRDFFDKEN